MRRQQKWNIVLNLLLFTACWMGALRCCYGVVLSVQHDARAWHLTGALMFIKFSHWLDVQGKTPFKLFV